MDARTLVEQGHAAFGRGDEAQALECFTRVLALEPRHVDALNCRGILLGRLNQIEAALRCFAQALEIDPRNVAALVNSGIGLAHLGRLADAHSWFASATFHDPTHIEAWMRRGGVLAQLNRPMEAAECFAAVLRLDPRHIGARLEMGRVLQSLNRGQEALMCFGDAFNNLHRFPEALDCFDRLAAVRPRDTLVLVGRAVALAGLDRHAEALDCLRQALRIQPNLPEAINYRSFIHLAQGRLAQGFQGQEVRWKLPPYKDHKLQTPAPLWLGGESIRGKTILVHHERRMGDTLQFARYAPLLTRRGARVLLRLPVPLLELMRTLEGVADVVEDGAPLPPHDFHCPVMSLPLAFGTTLETIPADIPYLNANTGRVSEWSERLGPGTRPRIGLAWAGQQVGPIHYSRDMPLEALQPLLDFDAEFISLQKFVAQGDLPKLAALPIARHGEAVSDYADTAALIANLDLVIATATSVVHLAGALGKPVWVMNAYSPCWRWLRGRSDSPWYPTARLFRQPAFGDWTGVVQQVKQALPGFLSEHRQGRREG